MWESIKLADNQQVVDKIELNQEEFEFMEENKERSLWNGDISEDFDTVLCDYVTSCYETDNDKAEAYAKLFKAYFNGYVRSKEKYYIEFPVWVTHSLEIKYLSYDIHGTLHLVSKKVNENWKNQFTQDQIEELQKHSLLTWVNLNKLKVKVPDEELVDW